MPYEDGDEPDGVQPGVPVHPESASLPRMRRELLAYKFELRTTLELLTAYANGSVQTVHQQVAHALACAAFDLTYPSLDHSEDRRFRKGMEMAAAHQLREHVLLAAEIVQAALAISISANESLKMIDALGESLSFDWHNLAAPLLCRRLNRHGHALARGRIPGWREGT
jgi:hypothetical protein